MSLLALPVDATCCVCVCVRWLRLDMQSRRQQLVDMTFGFDERIKERVRRKQLLKAAGVVVEETRQGGKGKKEASARSLSLAEPFLYPPPSPSSSPSSSPVEQP